MNDSGKYTLLRPGWLQANLQLRKLNQKLALRIWNCLLANRAEERDHMQDNGLLEACCVCG